MRDYLTDLTDLPKKHKQRNEYHKKVNKWLGITIWVAIGLVGLTAVIAETIWEIAFAKHDNGKLLFEAGPAQSQLVPLSETASNDIWKPFGENAVAEMSVIFAYLGLVFYIVAVYIGRFRNWGFTRVTSSILAFAVAWFVIAIMVSIAHQKNVHDWYARIKKFDNGTIFSPYATYGFNLDFPGKLAYIRAVNLYIGVFWAVVVLFPLVAITSFWYAFRNGVLQKLADDHKKDYLLEKSEKIEYRTQETEVKKLPTVKRESKSKEK